MTPTEPQAPEIQNDATSDATYRAIIDELLCCLNVPSMWFDARHLRHKREANDLIIVTDPSGNITVGRKEHGRSSSEDSRG